MRTSFLIAIVTIASFALSAQSRSEADEPAARHFRFAPTSDRSLGLWDGDRPVLVYNHGPIAPPGAPASRGRACYFHPVYGLDGEAMTDDFPRDHTYHRGMYVAWPHIMLGDKEYELWTARGELKQVFQKFLAKNTSATSAELGIENAWTIGDKPAVREEMWLTIHPAAADARSIDIRLTWTSLTEPLTLSGAEGKSYGGFNFRFGPRTKTTITVPEKTPLPEGVTADQGRVLGDLLMTRLPWADFTGDFAGAKEMSGAAIFVHPQHPDFPPTWMTRHYGLVSVGWPGVEPKTFPAGQTITCQYRLWIHRGQKSAAQIQAAYDSSWPKTN
jgi:hypothetical protein